MINDKDRNDMISIDNADEAQNKPIRGRILFLVDNHMIDDDALIDEGADGDCISVTIPLGEFVEGAEEEDDADS
jgi:hypothetical protein